MVLSSQLTEKYILYLLFSDSPRKLNAYLSTIQTQANTNREQAEIIKQQAETIKQQIITTNEVLRLSMETLTMVLQKKDDKRSKSMID